MVDPANSDVRVAEESDLVDWQRFVDETPGAGCMHHSAWYGVLRDAYWVKPYFLMSREASGQVTGILPLYHSLSPLTGSHLSSLEDGVLAVSPQAGMTLLVKARSLRDVLNASYLQIRGGPVDQEGSKVFTAVRTLINTSQSIDGLWSSIKKKKRETVRRIRIAESSMVRIENDADLSGIDDFYGVYAEHMCDLGTPVMGIDSFHAMRSHFGPRRLRLYLVKEKHRIIGGMLCILNKDRWTDYYAIMRPSSETQFANYLLYWHVIRDAASSGAPLLDLGRSMLNSTVHHFKRKWGGWDVEVNYHFYFAAQPRSPWLEGLKRGNGLPQRIWSHLPLAVCNRFGPLLRKQLPFI
jgi:serine/alanine adding enzyme